MSDFRALCVELLRHAECAQRVLAGEEVWDGDEDEGLFARAHAELAAYHLPVVNDAELLATAASAAHIDDVDDAHEEGYPLEVTTIDILNIAHAVLVRYGTVPAQVPVPIAERLPGPEDCDAEGNCWLFSKVNNDWRLINAGNPGVPHLKYCFSHWLPAHALPLPEVPT